MLKVLPKYLQFPSIFMNIALFSFCIGAEDKAEPFVSHSEWDALCV